MQENQNNNNEVEELDLNHLMQIRRDKIQLWKIWRKGCNSNRKNNCQKNNGKSIILYNTR